MKRIFAAALLTLFAFSSFAAESAAGKWKTFDDKTKQPKGEVTIYEENGVFYGKIGKSLDPNDQGKKVCSKCKGEFKDKPLEGMRFMWGFKRNGDKYTQGKILDPNTGDVYSANMTLKNNGDTLALRGYMGMPMFGRTQIWERIK